MGTSRLTILQYRLKKRVGVRVHSNPRRLSNRYVKFKGIELRTNHVGSMDSSTLLRILFRRRDECRRRESNGCL
jgi:hypothetical protein